MATGRFAHKIRFFSANSRFSRRRLPLAAAMRVGLLGGSFDPAHQGHLAISLYALKFLALDRVIWLVSPQNPQKNFSPRQNYPQRLEQSRHLARHPRILVSDFEQPGQTRYTIDTVEKLIAYYPNTAFLWLMGADHAMEFHRWRDWQKLMHLVPIAIGARPGYMLSLNGCRLTRRFAYARLAKSRDLVWKKPPAWMVFQMRLNPLSSTKLRENHLTKTPIASKK